MVSPALPAARNTRHSHAAWLLVIAAALALALGVHGPIPQWASYHAFADARNWFGLPNAENVLSNLPFAWIGVWGLSVTSRAASARDRHGAWWWVSEQHGHGDLRPYLFVQFLPMLLVPAALWLRLPARGAHALRNGTWWTVLGLYAAAKTMELADQTVFDALGFTSGHTLKHLLAAAAALCLLRGAAGLSFGSRR